MFILLVDDDVDDCGLFREIIREIDPGGTVVARHDGIEAIKYLSEDGVTMPDMIFLDVNMPKMNGKQVFLMLQKDERLSRVPVVIYSTSISDREIRYYESYGANCLVKPSTYQDLKGALSKLIIPYVNT